MGGELWQKIALMIMAAVIGFTAPVLTYEFRIANLEVSLRKMEENRFRREDADLLLKDLEIKLKDYQRDIISNRTFIQRECHRNNNQDEILEQKPLNNCVQGF